MREAQGPRDEMELSLNETLAPFFDVKSILFATPEVKPRPTARPGWEETVPPLEVTACRATPILAKERDQ